MYSSYLTLAEQAATKFDAFGWILGRFLDQSNVMTLEMAQNGHILAHFWLIFAIFRSGNEL